MIKISELNKILDKDLNNYELSTIVAKRTRQLVEGAKPLVTTGDKESNVTIATLEFAEKKFDVISIDKKGKDNT